MMTAANSAADDNMDREEVVDDGMATTTTSTGQVVESSSSSATMDDGTVECMIEHHRSNVIKHVLGIDMDDSEDHQQKTRQIDKIEDENLPSASTPASSTTKTSSKLSMATANSDSSPGAFRIHGMSGPLSPTDDCDGDDDDEGVIVPSSRDVTLAKTETSFSTDGESGVNDDNNNNNGNTDAVATYSDTSSQQQVQVQHLVQDIHMISATLVDDQMVVEATKLDDESKDVESQPGGGGGGAGCCSSTGRNGKKQWIYFLSIGIVTVAVIVGLVVGLTYQRKQPQSSTPASSSSSSGNSQASNPLDPNVSDEPMDQNDLNSNSGNSSSLPPVFPPFEDFDRYPTSKSMIDAVLQQYLPAGIWEFLTVNTTDSTTTTTNDANTMKYGPHRLAYEWILDDPAIGALYTAQEPTTIIGRLLQRFALVTLYHSMNGPSWPMQDGWLTSSHECMWFSSATFFNPHSSVCQGGGDLKYDSNLTLHVPFTTPTESWAPNNYYMYGSFEVFNNNVTGFVPEGIWSFLPLLEFLSLEDNDDGFTGTQLPPDFSQATSLRFLVLPKLGLTGPLPDVSQMSLLEEIALNENDFTGTLDSMKLGHEVVMDVERSNFNQNRLLSMNLRHRLPREKEERKYPRRSLGSPSEQYEDGLYWLFLHGNPRLGGTLPTALTNFPRLMELNVIDTNVTGPVSEEICDYVDELSPLLTVFANCSTLTGCRCCTCAGESSP